MPLRRFAAVLGICILPAASHAACGWHEASASCKDGMVWDQSKGQCVASPTT